MKAGNAEVAENAKEILKVGGNKKSLECVFYPNFIEQLFFLNLKNFLF